ncbi:hypothetical protein OB905_00820 [Halobacteria archaeon AArc-dxtr1]|nr:hypothetical protein [Halobacteria archaeon AArc-dxtr1]
MFTLVGGTVSVLFLIVTVALPGSLGVVILPVWIFVLLTVLFAQIDRIINDKLSQLETTSASGRGALGSEPEPARTPETVVEQFYSAVASGDDDVLRSLSADSGSWGHALLNDEIDGIGVADIDVLQDESEPIEIRARLIVTVDGVDEERVESVELRSEGGEWRIWSVARSA